MRGARLGSLALGIVLFGVASGCRSLPSPPPPMEGGLVLLPDTLPPEAERAAKVHALYSIGIHPELADEYDRAADAYRQAYELDPDQERLALRLASMLALQRQPEEALRTVEDFRVMPHWDGPYHGLDFGFAADPTAAVQCYICDRVLYIRREAGKTKLELDATGQYVTDRIPLMASHTVRADSARPESISYLRRHGIPTIEAVEKWPGSVEDGIAHIRSYESVVIHPDCEQTAREFRLYSYKTDRQTGDIKPEPIDANNHYIDALRYALAPMIRRKGGGFFAL